MMLSVIAEKKCKCPTILVSSTNKRLEPCAIIVHYESINVTRVTLIFHSIPNGGTRLTLHQEGYSKNSETKKTRDEHIEGFRKTNQARITN